MAGTPTPFVHWSQKDDSIHLGVDLKDAKDVKIEFDDQSISCSALGKGARGLATYGLNLKFYGKIDTDHKDTKHNVLDSHIAITLKKQTKEFWPRLTSAPLKPPWLKVDFSKWQWSQENLPDEEEVGDIMEDFPQVYDSLEKEERGYRTEDYKKVYLTLYNLFEFVGFLYVLIVIGLRYSSEGADSMATTYENVGTAMKLLLLFQYLEILHPLFGYTNNKVINPLLQILGRSLVLFAMIEAEPRMQTKPVVFYLFVVWSAIEIVRYPFYIAQLNNFEIKGLTWLRYTIWIPLYPLGILCEGIILLRNIPYFEETKRFSIAMPNSLNFAFDMPSAMRLYLIFLFLPGSYVLMSHMYKDRVKRLAPNLWRQKKSR